MVHYRLSKADSVGSEGQLYADAQNEKEALLNFEGQLKVNLSESEVTLSLNCDAGPDYVMQSRTYDEVNFANSERVDVCRVRLED